MNSTPLLRLLDSVMSKDSNQIQLGLKEARELLSPFHHGPSMAHTNFEEIVVLLLRTFPNLASAASKEDGSLPLHFAASIGSVGVASTLITMYPQAASIANKKGKIPLHYAAREGRTEMVQFLLQVDPFTARIPTRKQKLPLHFAAGEGHTNVVRALLRVSPEGASIPSLKGKIPLHFAARWGHMMVAKDLVRYHPQGVSWLDWEGSLPLHDAAREGQISMTRFLFERYPRGLSTANMRGEIPLFPAVRSGNVPLVICLLQAWPMGGKHILRHVTADDNIAEWDSKILELCLRGAIINFNNCTIFDGHVRSDVYLSTDDGMEASEVDSCQCIPVETQAIQPSCAPLPVARQDPHPDNTRQDRDVGFVRPKSPVIEVRPSKKRCSTPTGLSEKRSKLKSSSINSKCSCCPATNRTCKFYHIHAALSCGASASVLEVAVKRFSVDELRVPDCQGQLPLHIAMSNTTNNDAIDIVLKNVLGPYPEAATIRDNKRRLPLHVALESQANFLLTQALLHAYPLSEAETCNTTDDRYTNKAPLWMATACDCDLSTTYILLRSDPSLLLDLL